MSELKSLLGLAVETVAEPRAMARRLIDARYSDSIRLLGLGLVVVLTAILSSLAIMMVTSEERAAMGMIGANPTSTALVQGIVILITVFSVHFLGRLAGGTGQLRDALLLMVWQQFILVLLQAAQIIVQLVLPPLAVLLSFASFTIMFWLLSNFVAELHGFRSVLLTFLGILAGLFLLGFVLALTVGPAMLGVPT